MSDRTLSISDKTIGIIDNFLKNMTHNIKHTNRKNPADSIVDVVLSAEEKKLSACLLRIDHTGEVCAQALYEGQAFSARNPELRIRLAAAAEEEGDHLQWCKQRITELGGTTSIFNPLFYTGSFIIGVTAGLAGDKWNLGFLEATERGVEAHLQDHLKRLPGADKKTQAILSQMVIDEVAHAQMARDNGAAVLPFPMPYIMNGMAKIMTTLTFYA